VRGLGHQGERLVQQQHDSFAGSHCGTVSPRPSWREKARSQQGFDGAGAGGHWRTRLWTGVRVPSLCPRASAPALSLDITPACGSQGLVCQQSLRLLVPGRVCGLSAWTGSSCGCLDAVAKGAGVGTSAAGSSIRSRRCGGETTLGRERSSRSGAAASHAAREDWRRSEHRLAGFGHEGGGACRRHTNDRRGSEASRRRRIRQPGDLACLGRQRKDGGTSSITR